MLKIKNILIFLAFIYTQHAQCQEINCVVQCISPTALTSAADKEILVDLQKSIYEFMNNTKWTKDIFNIDERIDCNILINITEKVSSDHFRGSIQIQSSRPAYNTSYKSTMFNYNDNDFEIGYLRNTALIFTPDQFHDNLTSILAYYAYIIIALDYDSFALKGGTPYYLKAQQIVTNAANTSQKGWKAFEGTSNRYWLVDNILQSTWEPLRQAIYTYHRLGIDKMYSEMASSRLKILDALGLIEKVHKTRPGTFNVQLFFTAKADELVDMFSQANSSEKVRAYNILKEVDPGNLSKYQKITSNN